MSVPSFRTKASPADRVPRERLAGWCEVGLDAAAVALFPLLAIESRGMALLATFAGVCAAALTVARPPLRLDWLRLPAGLLALLVGWGALSAAWSPDWARSLILASHLFALGFCGLALAAAAGRMVRPQRVVRCLLIGGGIGIALAASDLAAGGMLYRLVHIRGYTPTELNQIEAALAILVLPVAATLWCRLRRSLAVAAAAIMVGAVLLLLDSTAKLGLVIAVPVAALVYWRRAAVARALAALAVLGVLAAPATLPLLARLPGLLRATESFKMTLWHRLLIWFFVGGRIGERPLAGWGLDSSRAIPGGKVLILFDMSWLPLHPHDAALQVWLELGVPGAILFALLLGWLWLRLGEAGWPRLYGAAAAAAFVAALTVASASYGIWQEWWLGTLALSLFLVLVMGRAAEPP
jgi:O-antigen ligase